jgi:ABC-type multidrug transport system ATPase subunit
MTAISLRDVCKSYGSLPILKHITLEVQRGEIFGLFGANGSGKSTLLRILVGAMPPTSGSVSITGITGYVPQTFSLYDDLFLEQNLAFYGRCYGLSGSHLITRIEDVLARLHLSDLRKERTGNLSHGLKQRVALAAALCHQPSIVLLDEATAGLDPAARRELWDILRDCARSGVTVLISTHHADEAGFCDRTGYLLQGELTETSKVA